MDARSSSNPLRGEGDARMGSKGPSAVAQTGGAKGNWSDGSHWDRQQPVQSPLTGYGRGDLYSNSAYDDAHVDGGYGHHGPAHNPHGGIDNGDWKARTESEIITEQLHRQGQLFPPPPPPICPPETRRQRAELWSRSASKWDITCTVAPPPRCPLDGMDQEHRRRLQPLSLVPYKGDQWLVQSEHWFGFVQKNFKYPPDNQPAMPSFSFVSECCNV